MNASVGLLSSTKAEPERRHGRTIGEDFAGNTGNMVFDDALQSLYPAAAVIPQGGAELIACHSHVLVSLANVISSQPMGEGLEQVWRRLQRARRLNPDLTVVVTSIGAQFDGIVDHPIVHPTRVDLLRDLSAWAAYVGVRGFYTSEVLHDLGIENTWVVGDPALLHPAIGGMRPQREELGGPVVHWTPTGKYRDKLRELMRWAISRDCDFVAQTDSEGLVPSTFPGRVEASPRLDGVLEYYLWPHVSEVARARGWILRRGSWFTTPRDWYAFLSSKTLSIGSRYHGNAAAVIAGIPALQLTFDSRTTELCAFHGLPSIALCDFDEREPLESYLELARRDGVRSRVEALRRNLWGFWTAVGMPGAATTGRSHSPQLRGHSAVGRSLRTRYLRDSIEHSLTLCGTQWVPDFLLESLIDAVRLPRDTTLSDLVEIGPAILHAVRQLGETELAGEVAWRLGIPAMPPP